MARREREILVHAVRTVAEQAVKADDLVDEAIAVGHGRSDPLVTHAKMLRLELLKVKAGLERESRTSPSTVRSAASKFTGSAASASRPGTGRIESQRRMASQWCRAELLIDCEEDPSLRAVVGMLREEERR